MHVTAEFFLERVVEYQRLPDSVVGYFCKKKVIINQGYKRTEAERQLFKLLSVAGTKSCFYILEIQNGEIKQRIMCDVK